MPVAVLKISIGVLSKNIRLGSGLLCLFVLCSGWRGSGGGECGECGGCAPSPIVEHSNTTNIRSEKSPLFAFIVGWWCNYTFATYKAVYLPSN